MKLGAAGTSLIQSFEKLVLACYPDQRGIPTIGWGHKVPGMAFGTPCTVAQATDWFLSDVGTAEKAVNVGVLLPLTQNQFDALVAFTYNVGITAFRTSTLLRLLNEGNTSAASQEFVKWDHEDGVVSPGLLRRRKAETALFLS